MSSKNNDSFISNLDMKSSKIIKVSKDRVESAKNRVNYITLKFGDLDVTSQIKNDLNKRKINKVVSNMEKKILINSKSYGRMDRDPKDNLRSYLKEMNVKSSNKKNRSVIKSNAKKKNNYNIVDSNRNLKTSENENNNNIYDNINLDDVYKKYKIKIVDEKKEENDDDNINNEEKLINLVKNINEVNNSRNIGNSEEGKFMENLKSEEEKKYIISSSSNNIVKNNNFLNRQFSDKPVNCISEEEVDSKNKILVSKLEIDSGNTKLIKNERENSHKILPTENNELIKGLENKNNIIDSESSKTNKLIDDNSEFQSENDINKKKENNNNEVIKINNKLDGKNEINSNDNNIKLDETKINKEEKKQNIEKYKTNSRATNKKFEDYRLYRKNFYKRCSICENNFPLHKLFVSSCTIHYLCRICLKYYYEDLIENGIKDLNCPFIKCKKPFETIDLKNIISSHHLNLLKNDKGNLIEKSNDFYYNKKKEIDDEGITNRYSKKNFIDINTNKKLYNYKNSKGVVCSNCNKESLFSKTNTHFLKCLNCQCKKCKYCLKKYDDDHMDINSPNHCKVYYRYERKDLNNNGLCLRVFLQLLFVIACYFLCFASAFKRIRNVFYFVFRAKTTGNIMLYIFSYFFTVFFFIIIIPFFIVFYPYFPCIMSSTDY